MGEKNGGSSSRSSSRSNNRNNSARSRSSFSPATSMASRFRSYLRTVLSVVAISIIGLHLSRGSFVHGYSLPRAAANKLVPLEAHIISKCPDTKAALHLLILPVMKRVHHMVDFKLNYIGKPAAGGRVTCKHGQDECKGNIIELCARELYPDPLINLEFINCLSQDFMRIPQDALVERCAVEHGIDVARLKNCAIGNGGAHGLELLRESVKRTAETWGIFCVFLRRC
ncbi:gamma interferon inducible lysosomal thiol reductase [Drechmeria coniospora]|uniref:Gamma interferon inducible lysosomal thiol reductase n=1 Tax=Drechmeria coniospora TaxID=98403 RepID=A0A151GR48_DRECN|nr:gamma interferon inducible lysosomal thiol reductase [Drechmeria coniospora]KYK59472.1 gamma interferon inducible lysosomal thiol reductase [Drechmeria coniospora]